MRRQVIAVDCDDVLLPSAQLLVDDYNRRFNTSAALSDIYQSDPGPWQVPDFSTAVTRMNQFLSTSEFVDREPFPDALPALRQLARFHDLHIVTGRNDSVQALTEAWVQRQFTDIFKSLHFTGMFQSGRPPIGKADICRQVGVTILIDDHLGHALPVAAGGVAVLLFGDYPWNRTTEPLPNNITRVADWSGVLHYFDEPA